jgi:4-hydroxy-tetrahydrodipicolinate synthase
MTGLFAAVATPVDGDGRLHLAGLDRLVDFLVAAGVDGICIGGATGEYPHFEGAERAQIIDRSAARLPKDRALLVGIGAPSVRATIELGQRAIKAGARALLLPMPMFFRYEQQDLQAYASHVSRALRAPCFLYDLPDFTNGLAADTALTLLADEEFIVGFKDSSGRAENLAAFAGARRGREWTLLVGNDRMLFRGLQAGWNGGISGVAGFCPELLTGICRSFDRGHVAEAARLQGLLDELIAQIDVLPTPWGIRAGLQARGIDTGPLPLPLSSARRRQIDEFQRWFGPWLAGLTLAPMSTPNVQLPTPKAESIEGPA